LLAFKQLSRQQKGSHVLDRPEIPLDSGIHSQQYFQAWGIVLRMNDEGQVRCEGGILRLRIAAGIILVVDPLASQADKRWRCQSRCRELRIFVAQAASESPLVEP
jgi:hypothetical protein